MKKKSFIYQILYFALIPLSMGLVFMILAIVLQLVPMDGITINDVYTEDISEIRNFRLIFLAIFGGIGFILLLIGLFFIGYVKQQKNKNQSLKEQGVKVNAEIIAFQATSFSVNDRNLLKLACTAKINGTDYIFKSQPLRLNPLPFLKNNSVDVYYDLGNMKRYFVDVDGSVRDRDIVEL